MWHDLSSDEKDNVGFLVSSGVGGFLLALICISLSSIHARTKASILSRNKGISRGMASSSFLDELILQQ